jgi:hypothetical protein
MKHTILTIGVVVAKDESGDSIPPAINRLETSNS